MLLLSLNRIGLVGNVAFGYRICEDALLLLRIVETEGRAEVESLEEVEVDVGIAKGTPVGVAVVSVALKHCNWVGAVGIATHRSGIATVCGVYRQRGVELQHILEETSRGSNLGCTVEGEVLANGELVVQELVLGVETGRETLKVACLDDTHILVIAEREVRRAFLRAIAYAYVIVLYNAGAYGLVVPVGIGCRCCAGIVEILLHSNAVENGLSERVVPPIVAIAQAIGVRVQTVVDVALPHNLAKLLGIEHLHLMAVH